MLVQLSSRGKLAQFDVNTPSARDGRRRRRCTNREAQYE
jgi:hypothetical protein